LVVIATGAFVLSLPQSTVGPERLSMVDSLFTATSATCVTGLVVWDTGTTFTAMGRWVIFFLFQAGGLGIMTFSTLFAVLMGRKIGFYQSDAIKSTLDRNSILGLNKLIMYILVITFSAEVIGAGLLFARWMQTADWGVVETAQQAVFHSVSGFCNAGFSLFGDSFSAFTGDPVINITMIGLIFFGGIGFIVILDLLGLVVRRGTARRLSLQSKIALTVSGALILAGAAMIFFFENDNVLKAMGPGEKIWGSVFQSVTARTAGFNTLPIGDMMVPSLLVLVFLMFVGASPGSTGGGIKTCTFAVILATIGSMMGNKKRPRFFNRSVPRAIIREALAIFFLALAWIFLATITLAYLERNNPAMSGRLMSALFEVTSAFGTVGLSTGITPGLSDAGKMCITATMFFGRLGPLTLALAVAFRDKTDKFVYPEESMMVG
jgi:trk system potassium uptake protein